MGLNPNEEQGQCPNREERKDHHFVTVGIFIASHCYVVSVICDYCGLAIERFGKYAPAGHLCNEIMDTIRLKEEAGELTKNGPKPKA